MVVRRWRGLDGVRRIRRVMVAALWRWVEDKDGGERRDKEEEAIIWAVFGFLGGLRLWYLSKNV